MTQLEGPCHICGKIGTLSFEHVPPKKAFNSYRVIKGNWQDEITLGPDAKIKGPIEQKGAGFYTLCERCNNITGHWYGHRFVDWCYLAMELLGKTDGQPSHTYLSEIYPLAIIKQIITMIFSVNRHNFRDMHPERVHFVLNRDEQYLSPRYKVYVYYNLKGRLRYSGTAGLFDIRTGKVYVFSEITFPPFGYVMTIESDPPDPRLANITHFARYGYNEIGEMSTNIPVLETHLATLPGDYRTRAHIQADFEHNAALK